MSLAPIRRARRAATGFTLLEVVVAMALGSVVFAAALAGIIFLQKSYAATEQYATSLADQTRLLDYLAMDLRRATAATLTTSGGVTTGLTLKLPNYYVDPNVPNAPNAPKLNLQAPYYDSGNDPTTSITVVYSLKASFSDPKAGTLLKAITRKEGAGRESAVAAGMFAFPDVTFWDSSGAQVATFEPAVQAHFTLSFNPMFQTPATPDTNKITLHALTFLRNNDSRSQ